MSLRSNFSAECFQFIWEIFVNSNEEEHKNAKPFYKMRLKIVKRGMVTYGSYFTAWVERNLCQSDRVYMGL